jgi:hypothetical protein
MGGGAESGGDENGENAVAIDGNEEMRGETRTADRDDYGKEEAITGAGVMNNRIDLLEFFRRGKAHVTLLISERAKGTTTEYSLNITVKEALRTRGLEARRVILKELRQMIEKKIWKAVQRCSLSAAANGAVIRSSKFLREKFLSSGEFEQLKVRLVAGGDQQDKDLYDDLSAPTVSTCSVFTVLAIAAHEGRNAAVVDIGGAFLNAEMTTGIDVHMRLDRTINDMMVELDPRYEGYRDTKDES